MMYDVIWCIQVLVVHVMSVIMVSAIAYAVTHQAVTMEAQVQSQVRPCGIFGGQGGTGTDFSASTSVFPRHCHSTNAQFSLIHLSQILFIRWQNLYTTCFVITMTMTLEEVRVVSRSMSGIVPHASFPVCLQYLIQCCLMYTTVK